MESLMVGLARRARRRRPGGTSLRAVAEFSRRARLHFRLMINPLAYRTIAVASTFSPRFEQVLSEGKRMSKRFGAALSLIHVGERNHETAKKFGDILATLQLPSDSAIYYERGNPAEGILRALKENKIDMVIAGALEKEVVLHPFLGNVARQLVREADCSIMLFTEPEREPKPLRRIVFVADYSDHAREALKRTFHLALGESSERLYVIRVVTTFDEARAKAEGNGGKSRMRDDEEIELENFVLSAGATEVPIEARYIRGNTGFAAADFVKSVEADLLVIPVAPSSGGGSTLPSNVAWITDMIPCNLWLIR
jgi:nucleotide-binding universal stress UspA family protein